MIKELGRNQINQTRHDASQNHGSAYIFQQMRPTYRACITDSASRNGPGVTERRQDRLQKAIGSTQNQTLFKAIQHRLRYDLLVLIIAMMNIVDKEVSDILAQIAINIEMLRGMEAHVLAKNGDFLGRLGKVVVGAVKEMESIEEIANKAKREAEKDGCY